MAQQCFYKHCCSQFYEKDKASQIFSSRGYILLQFLYKKLHLHSSAGQSRVQKVRIDPVKGSRVHEL